MSLAFAIVFVATSVAHASGPARNFGPFFGVGLSKNLAKVAQPGVDATLNGWANGAEIGWDLPFSENFGLSLSGGIEQKQLRNSSQSDTYLDDTTINTKQARGLFFYKNFLLGGSYQMSGVDIRTISTSQGASTAHFDATGSSVFFGYSMAAYKGLLRANIEVESARFTSPGFSYTDYSAGLKLQLLLNGLFDRSN